MAQSFDDQNSDSGLNPEHLMKVARRRHIHFLVPLFLGWLAVWGVSWFLPPRYRSTTLILVEQPTMPKDYVMPNVADDLQERLQSITQQILSRTRLLHIIDEFGLYSGSRAAATPDEKVERMRKDIEIELVRDNSNRVTAFNVSYSSRDAHTAQLVTSELTNLFINENLEVRQQQSEGTTNFLGDQLDAARTTLMEQEKRVREFKLQHVGELPDQVQTNLQILNTMQAQLQNEGDALNSARQQHVYLETLLNQYRSLTTSPSTPGSTAGGLPALEDELARLKSQLADLSAHYTERHPDVRKVKEQIAKNEKMREQILADVNAKKTDTNSTSSSAVPQETSTRGASTPMLQLQSQLQANQAEITSREHAIVELNKKIADYQARLNQEPLREQQLADLARGYDQSKANYDDLLKKKNESAMATSMELRQQGERFRILDPPSLPLKPDFPNRLKFCAIGLGVGLALGVFVAGAFEMADDRIYSEKEFKELLPVPVICEIPVIAIHVGQEQHNKLSWKSWTAAAVVFTTILAGSVFSYLRG